MIKKLLSSVVFVGCFTLTLYGIYSIFRYITFCQEPIIELNKDFSEQEYNKELPLQLLISHDYSVK